MKNIFDKILATKFWWFFLLLLLIVINFLGSSFHTRFDLTKEKRYTLSRATIRTIKNLDDNITIDVFLKGDFPAGFKKLASSTDEFLRLLKDYNSAKVSYRFISPKDEIPGTTIKYGDSLVGLGATPINLTVQLKEGQQQNYVFPVALIHYRDKQQLVNLYSGSNRIISQNEINGAEALLEYDFLSALDKLKNSDKIVVAYALGNGEPQDYRVYDLQQVLLKDYRFFMFDLTKQPAIPDEIKALIIVKPSLQFSEDEKLKLDQYVMRGGKLLCYIDNLFAESDSLAFKSQTIAYDRNLNLTDLFFHYGARINTDLVMDLQCEVIPFVVGGNSNNPQQEFLHWNYYPLFASKNNHPINKNIGLVGGRFVNSMDTIKTEGVNKTILLSSSANSRTISTPALISLDENRNAPQDEKFNKSDIPVAVLLEGKFSSLFKNRVSQQQNDSLNKYSTPFVPASGENRMIIVADGDMAMNEALPDYGPLPMGWNKYTYLAYQQQSDDGKYFIPVSNRDFFENCLEYLVTNPEIIATRNKNIVLRLLDSKKIKEQKANWQLINIALPVFLIILLGLIYRQIRKKQYQ
ncbi:MAG: gliding motility-associated ABC transporter substrate-binding protein GldG [Bacteroidetes bacterium]|nr:gliding motility-associated ABC transporter substrate-binding protein GldG [Bacteroidota bacterium]MBS1931024.1 gliding motility-associated ABC transporter substrate-binding protein GldG [Bacteroidota bacterium]